MICPECKAEYREGFDRCDDCRIALVNTVEAVEASPEEGADPGSSADWTELLSTSNQSELTVLKGLLASAGLEHRVRGEEALHLYPVAVPGFFRSRGLAASLDVRRNDLRAARELLTAEVSESFEPGHDG